MGRKGKAYGKEMPLHYFFNEYFFKGLDIQLFPLGKAHKACFSTSL
jgi:hypothetical protein